MVKIDAHVPLLLRPVSFLLASIGPNRCPAPCFPPTLPTVMEDDTRNPFTSATLDGRVRLPVPGDAARVLLHSCCAPCSGEVMEAMLATGLDITIFFYNPNIHPREEYEYRKEDNIAFAQKANIPFVDADYDARNWFDRVRGLEMEPERGKRCTECFDMRFERTALYAHENNFPVFTSCLGISRWKNMDQINGCGHRAAARYEGLAYWDYNWRKNDGANRMIDISKREHFYQQEYCGCVFSLRDMNAGRAKQGRDKIEIGVHYYGTDTEVK